VLSQVKFPDSTFYVPQLGISDRLARLSIDDLYSQALSEPIEFPTLDQFILQGDRVAVVLMGNLPQPIESVRAVIGQIALAVEDVNIVVVISPSHSGNFDETTRSGLSALHPDQDIQFVLHDPDEQTGVACIANNEAGEPVYINRQMFDADVVIPVGTLPGDNEKFASIYPEFSTAGTLKRFENRGAGRQQQVLDAEIRLAEQHLGAEFSVFVVRGPGEAVIKVFAGRSQVIRRQIGEEMQLLWSIESRSDGELVIATIEGSAEHQSWDDFFYAVAAAAAASESVAQIVVCTSIDTEPESQHMEVLQLQFELDLDSGCRKLNQLTGVKRLIPGILESTSVFLMSRLDQDVVEEAGLGYLESDRELQKMIDRAESGILLRDAHLCRVTAKG